MWLTLSEFFFSIDVNQTLIRVQFWQKPKFVYIILDIIVNTNTNFSMDLRDHEAWSPPAENRILLMAGSTTKWVPSGKK